MELICTITSEMWPTSTRRTSYKDTRIILGRNEFRDLTLKLLHPKLSTMYPLAAVQVHKRFVREGKCTFVFPDHHIQVMVSNAPPNILTKFVNMVVNKSLEDESSKENKIPFRARMLSEKTNSFEDISPLADLIKESDRKRKLESDDTTPRKALTNVKRPANSALTSEQQAVLRAVSSGRNVFFTGSAGTGKSFLLKRILGALPPDATVATATTGVAASHIGGITLHAFAGIGSGSADLPQCLELAERKNVRQQWRKCRHLVVDEVSMLDGDFFDKLEAIGRHLVNRDKAFGGIQLILCGDFLQLPPVTKRGDKKVFCFQSRAWSRCMDVCLELTVPQRQSGDLAFANLLRIIRLGQCPESVSEALSATKHHTLEKGGICATRLCAHTEDVDAINKQHLTKLPGDTVLYNSKDNDPSATRALNTLCPVGEEVRLKVGTQVMLTKNLDVLKGMVNGARGVVVAFQSGLPMVRFLSGAERLISQEKFTMKLPSGLFLWRQQIPLKLAWAISIHKSQGMTLDSVEMSLSRVFECGQAYVALSRARSLVGLRVLDFTSSCVRAHPDVVKFYSHLQRSAS